MKRGIWEFDEVSFKQRLKEDNLKEEKFNIEIIDLKISEN
jgi:hypothetical protein